MTRARMFSLSIALLTGSAMAADTFDGSTPLKCLAQQGHDCVPGTEECSRLEPQGNGPAVFEFDFANKQVHSPFRTAVLRASQTSTNPESLILQGTDLLFAWSAVINKKTGAITVSIADRKGAYIVFGQCSAPKTP